MDIDWGSAAPFIITLIGMLAGLFGLVVPILPGTVIMWVSALAYGILGNWSTAGWIIFAIITVLMLVSVVADNLLMGATARKQGGAAWSSIILALIAGIVGTLLLPPIGGLIAAPAVILLLEYRRLGDWDQAFKAFRGLATGFGLSYVVRLGIGVVILGLWIVWVMQGQLDT